MKKELLVFIFGIVSTFATAQNEQLAVQYFEEGAFEKALSIFEESSKKQPSNFYFFQKTIQCFQQLSQFEKVETAIATRRQRYNQPDLFIELGYNFQLQKKLELANEQYSKALQEVTNEPQFAYQIAGAFEQKGLLDWAVKSYETAQKINPSLNFDIQIALLQGQLGNLEGMLNRMLDYGFNVQEGTATIQNQLNRFLQDDSDGSFAAMIRKNLLIRTQKSQDIYWNRFLSWFFVQQKEYGKAFVQEKAIYKRNPESIYAILNLGKSAIEEKQKDDATTIFQFILENATDPQLLLEANHFLLSNQIENAPKTEYEAIYSQLNTLIATYQNNPNLTPIVILAANFEAFYLNKNLEAKNRLNAFLTSTGIGVKQQALVKMALADILVLDDKFNQAILYFAQVEENLKNDVLANEASMKIAKTNFYKKDFDWTLQQVKALKQAPSLLIANDAVELFLLIQDHSAEDTLRVALQDYAKAELLLFKRKNDEALQGFLSVLETHKGKTIEEATLLKVAKLYEQKKEYQTAITYYKKIIDEHKEGIFMDEALFFMAEIYRLHLLDSEKAKPFYENVMLNHNDSLYYTESRKQFRLLRGDKVL